MILRVTSFGRTLGGTLSLSWQFTGERAEGTDVRLRGRCDDGEEGPRPRRSTARARHDRSKPGATVKVRGHRFRHAAAAAGWISVIVPLTVVLLSAALSPASNWTARTVLAGFCLLAIARPDAALLVTIAVVGFGIILSHLAGVPSLRVTEVLVVGSLAGFCVRALPQGTPF